MYYEGREQGMPVEWMRRVKKSLTYVSAQFNFQRTIGEYRSQLYEPAHAAFSAISADRFQKARERVVWNQKVAEAWPRIRFLGHGVGVDSLLSGVPVVLRARLDLAGLKPDDVRVEALVGHVGAEGELEQTNVLVLDPSERQGEAFLFEKQFTPAATGRLGLALRVSPNHFEEPLTRPCNSLLKWATENTGQT